MFQIVGHALIYTDDINAPHAASGNVGDDESHQIAVGIPFAEAEKKTNIQVK